MINHLQPHPRLCPLYVHYFWTCERMRTAIVGLTLLSLDDRVRKVGKKLGLDFIPD